MKDPIGQDGDVAALDFLPGRDRPLDFHWGVSEQAGIRAGWAPSSKRRYDRAALSLMASLVLARLEGSEWVSYSRRKAWYANQGRYCGLDYSYSRVIRIVDQLVGLGLAEEMRANPGDHLKTRLQSRLRATERLVSAFEGAVYSYNRDELLHMRDGERKLILYKDTPETRVMQQEIRSINARFSGTRIELPEECEPVTGALVKIGKGIIRIAPNPIVHRVFTRSSWECGGRLYWWGQQLPKATRARILIDGEPVIESDFKSLHPTLLYAAVGRDLPDDPYETAEFSRDLGKSALLKLLNAPGRGSAIGALLQSNLKDGSPWPLTGKETKSLVEAVLRKNEPIAKFMASDVGVRLQHVDSQIAIRVIFSCLRQGFVALPIHDSFISQKRHGELLLGIMHEELERAIDNMPRTKLPTRMTGSKNSEKHGTAKKLSLIRGLLHGPDQLPYFTIDRRGGPIYDYSERAHRLERCELSGEEYLPVPGETERLHWWCFGERWIEVYARNEEESWRSFAFGRWHERPFTMEERLLGRRIPGSKPDWQKWLKPLLKELGIGIGQEDLESGVQGPGR